MNAWLVVNAFLQTSSFQRMEAVFHEAARETGVRLTTVSNAEFLSDRSLAQPPEKALFFDKDLRLARRMELAGMRLYNSEQAITNCDDKTLTTLLLSQAGLPQPDTLLCPMTYPAIGYPALDFLDEVASRLGFPMVVKEGKGSFGKQVYLVHSMEELKHTVSAHAGSELLFQRFIKETAGQDIRLFVVGSQVVASIKRVNHTGDFRANLENGSTAHPYQASKEEEALALAASRVCGTDYAGVDILQSKNGPLVCEVNSNAHFLGLMAVTGVNPALSILRLMKEGDDEHLAGV